MLITGDGQLRLWLKKLRKKKNLTQHYVAQESGVSTQFYSYIENGDRCPSVEVAKKIAAVLSFDWTMFYETK